MPESNKTMIKDRTEARRHAGPLQGVDSVLDSIAFAAACVMAAAWPWGIFQRITGPGLTLIKVSSLVIIAAGAARLLRARTFAALRTGLEWPIGLMALACAQSAAHSLDRGASAALIAQYLQYFVLFYALILTVRHVKRGVCLCKLFVVSCILVSLYAIAAGQGWVYPAYLKQTDPLGKYVSAELRTSHLMRLAAATPDLNEGVLPALLAFPLLAVFLAGAGASTRRFAVLLLFAMAIVWAIVLSFSRSSLLIVALLSGVYLWTLARRYVGWWKTFATALALVMVAFAVAQPYLGALGRRALSGITERNASYIGRLHGFEVAWSLVPRYGLLGCGLGASDLAIRPAADPRLLGGATLHSVPFKLLLETGLLGLAAYLWLWFTTIQTTRSRLLRSEMADARIFGWGVLGAYTACFLVLAVQPFLALSLFPLLLAIGIGPASAVARDDKTAASAPSSWPGRHMAVAMISVAVVVLPNLHQYNRTADRLVRYADALYAGLEAERRGDWTLAREAVESAHAVLGGVQGAQAVLSAPYADIAEGLPDFPYLFRAVYLPERGTSPLAAGAFALGRIDFAEGRFKRAAEHFETALGIAPQSAVLAFASAEALWAAGHSARAVEAYGRASELESLPGNEAYRDRMSVIEDRLGELLRSGSNDPAAMAERTRLLRLRGRRDEAIQSPEQLPPVAEAGKEFHAGRTRRPMTLKK
ncbi:MAG: hypothetical protein AMXMBFR4_09920 [Candidatus Hydrogenedentota bacterium]